MQTDRTRGVGQACESLRDLVCPHPFEMSFRTLNGKMLSQFRCSNNNINKKQRKKKENNNNINKNQERKKKTTKTTITTKQKHLLSVYPSQHDRTNFNCYPQSYSPPLLYASQTYMKTCSRRGRAEWSVQTHEVTKMVLEVQDISTRVRVGLRLGIRANLYTNNAKSCSAICRCSCSASGPTLTDAG